MAADPRFNFVVRCPQTAQTQKSDGSARKDFFNAIGKVGDIEILNKIGEGAVSAGLRTIASASNAIRGGGSSAIIPNADAGVGTSGESGSNIVLAQVGINPQQAEKAGQFNPGVLNRGTAEAQSIFDRATEGNYKLDDIPGSLQDLQNLKSLTDGIFTEGASDKNRVELCGAKNYAQELIRYAPKHKFMFILQFTLKKEWSNWEGDSRDISKMAFLVKNTGRPNINIEHEEVNFYNFWSRVPKRTVYEPITMRFHDDSKNFGHKFFDSYLKAISPISRLGGFRTSNALNYQGLENSGMNGSRRDQNSSASLGALEGNNTAIIDTLRVFHLFDYGRFMSVYNYKNPKIISMNLDDLDMAEGATGNEIEFQFAYDALHITPVLDVKDHVDTVAEVSGKSFAHNNHIQPVYQAGPSSSDEAGGVTEMPPTEEEGLLDTVGGIFDDFADDAKQTYNSVYERAESAFDSLSGSDAGGGDAL